MVIVVISILGSGLLSLALLERKTAVNDYQASRAQYLAEAGIHLALAHLRQDPGWRQGLSTTYLPGVTGHISRVTVTERPLTLQIKSEAEVAAMRRAVTVELARPLTSYSLFAGNGQGTLTLLPFFTVIKGDILYLGNITLLSFNSHEGSLIASGDLDINFFSTVNGNAVAGGRLTNMGSINGKAYYGSEYSGNASTQPPEKITMTFPGAITSPDVPYNTGLALTKEEYTIAELQDIIASQGGETIVLYRRGDLVIRGSGTYSGRAIIAASGSITLQTDLQADAGSAWALIAGRDFYAGAPGQILDEIDIDGIVISGAAFTVTFNYCRIKGSLAARRHNIIGKLDVFYDPAFSTALSSTLKQSAWEVLSWVDTVP